MIPALHLSQKIMHAEAVLEDRPFRKGGFPQKSGTILLVSWRPVLDGSEIDIGTET